MHVVLLFDEGKVPNGYRTMGNHPFLERADKRVVPSFVLYGPNASGKTNIIGAFFILHKIISRGLTKDSYDPDRMQSARDRNTFFSISSASGSSIYRYEPSYDQVSIHTEGLYLDPYGPSGSS